MAFLLATYVQFVAATMRWRFDQSDEAARAMGEPEGGMLFFWHGRIVLGAVCRRLVKARSMRVMISLSPDGEFVTKAAARLGFPAIRGSTGRQLPGIAGKGGAAAFMEALDFIAAGGGVIITPDGPRGPAEIMQAGPVMLAKRGATRVFLVGLAARPTITLGSWDKTRLPVPFSRGCTVIEGPLSVPPQADRAEVEALRIDWQARLRALQARADVMLDDPQA
jgi:lysophospholipid acyltransferase (LPLAT)-like uncharacterized protein